MIASGTKRTQVGWLRTHAAEYVAFYRASPSTNVCFGSEANVSDLWGQAVVYPF
jgi:hypothetical protein